MPSQRKKFKIPDQFVFTNLQELIAEQRAKNTALVAALKKKRPKSIQKKLPGKNELAIPRNLDKIVSKRSDTFTSSG